MRIRFLLDENVPPLLARGLRRREPSIDVICVGDSSAPSRGTGDPELLRILERDGRALVTLNRRMMDAHLRTHIDQGRHTWGMFRLHSTTRVSAIVDALVLVWHASEAQEWIDRVEDIPW